MSDVPVGPSLARLATNQKRPCFVFLTRVMPREEPFLTQKLVPFRHSVASKILTPFTLTCGYVAQAHSVIWRSTCPAFVKKKTYKWLVHAI
jgi:hypothetical protein